MTAGTLSINRSENIMGSCYQISRVCQSFRKAYAAIEPANPEVGPWSSDSVRRARGGRSVSARCTHDGGRSFLYIGAPTPRAAIHGRWLFPLVRFLHTGEYLPCTFPVPSPNLPCTFPEPSRSFDSSTQTEGAAASGTQMAISTQTEATSLPPSLYLPCTFPVPSLYLPCTFPVPSP